MHKTMIPAPFVVFSGTPSRTTVKSLKLNNIIEACFLSNGENQRIYALKPNFQRSYQQLCPQKLGKTKIMI